MAGREKVKLKTTEARHRRQVAGQAGTARSPAQYALRLQARAGNVATARTLARVHYPHLRAVDPTHYTGETRTSTTFRGALLGKIDVLKAVYAQITNKSGWQEVTLTERGGPPGFPQVAGLSGIGGPWNPATVRATATVKEWYQVLKRWRDVLNEEYFTPAPGPVPPSYPGQLPYNFDLKQRHKDWIAQEFAARGVRRDSEAERAASTVTVEGGRLVRADGGRVDTSNSITWFRGVGWEIFVLSHTGQLHMASHLVGRRHHSSLLGLHDPTALAGTGARDAASAGEMLVRDGKIEQLSTKTGHYQSGENQLRQIVHMLVKRGADLSGTRLLDFAGRVISPDAATWWTTTGKSAYEKMKTDHVLAWYRREYSFDAINVAFEGMLGWHGYLMGGMWYWRKPNGANADAKDVRKALKATFPRRADPEATYGPENNRQVVAVSL